MNFRTLVFRNLKKVKKDFLLYALSFALASVANLLPPFVTSRIVDCFKAQDKVQIINSVLFWLLFFLIATLVQAVNQYIVRIRGAVFKEKFVAFIQRDLFNVIHAHSVSYFDDEMTNSISMAADYVSGRTGFLCFNIFFDMFRPVIVLFATFLIIAYQSPLLAFVLFLSSLPIFLIERFCLPKIHKLMILRGKAERIYTGFFGDSLANFKLVRYLGSFFTEHLKGYALLKNYLRTTYHAENKRNFYILSADLSEGFFFIFGYVVILYFTATDNLSLGTAFFAFTSLHELSHLFECINRSLSNLTEISGNMATHLELLYKPITVCDKPDAKPLCLRENSISFENVCFGYTSGRPVFKNLNLKISPNQKVGLVGQSGAGKSSFINLILRNHLPTSGEIFLGTQSIADIAGYTLHKNIAVVPQDVTLFNRSLYENLQIANPKASKEEIVEACKLAHIHDVIMALPQGYDTCVGERGILLSGGERQRIAIARAILQNAPILILDEATSALDSESEIAIQNALENLIKNKTVISIAHRLSTLRQMDRILVLDNGKIIEDGSPNDLLHRENSLFNHFYKLQTNGYISEENN